MTEKTEAPIELYRHADKKIDEVKKELEQLMIQDLNLSHKMDIVVTEQKLLKERFEEGVSKTVFKTFEAVQLMSSKFETLSGENRIRDHKIQKVEALVEWIYRGLVFVFVAGLLLIFWRMN